jgi:hypothetical protein
VGKAVRLNTAKFLWHVFYDVIEAGVGSPAVEKFDYMLPKNLVGCLPDCHFVLLSSFLL